MYFYRTHEIFSWLLQVSNDLKDIEDSGKIVWTVTYVFENSKIKDTLVEKATAEETKRKLIGKVDINKDDIQAVIPMAKVIFIAIDCFNLSIVINSN